LEREGRGAIKKAACTNRIMQAAPVEPANLPRQRVGGTIIEAPVRVELTMTDLQSVALATWPRRLISHPGKLPRALCNVFSEQSATLLEWLACDFAYVYAKLSNDGTSVKWSTLAACVKQVVYRHFGNYGGANSPPRTLAVACESDSILVITVHERFPPSRAVRCAEGAIP
jgi:hypothetical protein